MNEVTAERSRENLAGVARGQRRVLVGILLYLMLAAGGALIPEEQGIVLAVGVAVVLLFVLFSVFTLASDLFGRGKGILFTVLAVIPFVGLLVLLGVNAYATKLLSSYGYRVGLLGAFEPKQH